MRNWQRFEKLVQRIQTGLSPSARVTQAEWLLGRRDASHQCDVILLGTIAQSTFTAVSQCKDLGERVDLNCVRSLVTRLQESRRLARRSGYHHRLHAGHAPGRKAKKGTALTGGNVNHGRQGLSKRRSQRMLWVWRHRDCRRRWRKHRVFY